MVDTVDSKSIANSVEVQILSRASSISSVEWLTTEKG